MGAIRKQIIYYTILKGNFIDGVRSGTCSHEVPSVGGFDGSYNIMKLRIEELLNPESFINGDIVAGAFGLAGVDAPFQKKALEEVVKK